MSWINDLLNKLKPSGDEPVTFDTEIKRPVDITEVAQRETVAVKLFLSELYYHYSENDVEGFRGSNSLVARSKYASGVVINRPEGTSESTFMCVFDEMKRKVEALQYRVNYQNCEVIITEKTEEKKEIVYLKPHLNYSKSKPYVQRFGNVKMERIVSNGLSRNLTLLCTYYSGFNYTSPIPFDDFIRSVCKSDNVAS